MSIAVSLFGLLVKLRVGIARAPRRRHLAMLSFTHTSLFCLSLCCVAPVFATASNAFLVSRAVSAESDRETQAPLVWVNLHKSALESSQSGAGKAYEEYAAQRLSELQERKR